MPHTGLPTRILYITTFESLSQGSICTMRVHLGLSKVALIEGCPHIRGGLYEGCTVHWYADAIFMYYTHTKAMFESPVTRSPTTTGSIIPIRGSCIYSISGNFQGIYISRISLVQAQFVQYKLLKYFTSISPQQPFVKFK